MIDQRRCNTFTFAALTRAVLTVVALRWRADQTTHDADRRFLRPLGRVQYCGTDVSGVDTVTHVP